MVDSAQTAVVPVDDDDDLLDPHSLRGSGYQDKRPKLESSSRNPDDLLDDMLARRRMEETPPWVLSLQNSIETQFGAINANMASMSSRLNQIETLQRQPDPRIAQLENQVADLSRVVANLQANQRNDVGSFASHSADARVDRLDPSPPRGVDPRPAPRPAPPRQTMDTDFNHIIVGGWRKDSKRGLIEEDVWKLFKPFQQEIDQVLIYGKRSKNANVHLVQKDFMTARDRFYNIQQNLSRKVLATGSENLIWLSPSRTPERRLRNRSTRDALSRLVSMLGEQDLDTDWTNQIIWHGDTRVGSGVQSRLHGGQHDRVSTLVTTADSGEATQFYINLTLLSHIKGKPEDEVERELHSC